MSEKPPSGNFINWERLRQDAEFQRDLLQALALRIVVRKYPDFYDRSKARTKRLRETGSSSPDAIDLEQKDFEKRASGQSSIEDLRKFSEREGIPFPEGQEFKEAEEEALSMYNDELESRVSNGSLEERLN